MTMDLEGYKIQEMGIRNKALRTMLFKKNPHCYWCGIETKEYECMKRDLVKGEKYPDDMVTLEHLYDRFEYDKRCVNSDNKYKVIACYKCNNTRGKIHVARQSKEYLIKRQNLLAMRKQKGIKTPRPIFLLQNL